MVGSNSTPDSPTVRAAVAIHHLDTALASMPDEQDRQHLVELVRQWLEHHLNAPPMPLGRTQSDDTAPSRYPGQMPNASACESGGSLGRWQAPKHAEIMDDLS
jgi:hypothetical protein